MKKERIFKQVLNEFTHSRENGWVEELKQALSKTGVASITVVDDPYDKYFIIDNGDGTYDEWNSYMTNFDEKDPDYYLQSVPFEAIIDNFAEEGGFDSGDEMIIKA
jgi:hypothetical protein